VPEYHYSIRYGKCMLDQVVKQSFFYRYNQIMKRAYTLRWYVTFNFKSQFIDTVER